jgi:hypothetical protein
MTHTLALVSKGISQIKVILDIYFLLVLNFILYKYKDIAIRKESLDLFKKITSSIGR